MSETSSRLLELLSLLQGRRDWPGGELAERLGVSRRTVRRDVDRLRELGYPIDSTVGPAGGYRLAAGAEVPPLLLEDEEAVAIAVGLRTAAQAAVEGVEEASLRALVKLEQVLPARLRHRLSALQSAELLSYRGPTVDPQCLATVGAACRDSERLRFAYRDREGAETRREVEPHSLVNAGRRWYLVAWDLKREDWRSFRLDRIARPAPMGVRSKARTLPTKDAATYVMQSVRNMPSRYEARIILHAPAERDPPAPPRRLGRPQAPLQDPLRVPHRRRRPRLARPPHRHAPLRLRGPRLTGAGRATGGDGRAASAGRGGGGRGMRARAGSPSWCSPFRAH